jgi:hypothetical protein
MIASLPGPDAGFKKPFGLPKHLAPGRRKDKPTEGRERPEWREAIPEEDEPRRTRFLA